MSKTIAIDIVLLPPSDVWEWAIQLSDDLNKDQTPLIKLDETHIPHITIVQSFVDADRLPDLFTVVNAIAVETRPLELTINKIYIDHNTAAFDIELTAQLEELFSKTMMVTDKFKVSPDAGAFILDEGEVTRPGTMKWVTSFRSQVEYHPHISLAQHPNNIPKIAARTFTVTNFAVCHLGNFCTCRKIIQQWKLNN